MLKRLKKRVFGGGKASTGTQIVVTVEKLETRVALLEDDQLDEYNIERVGDENIVGSIFKGRVKNIEQGLKAMFVDIGTEKNAFLHFWDAIPAATSVYFLDLISNREVSKTIAQKFSVHHESPQLLLIKNGECIYETSHGEISAEDLAEQMA